MKSKDTYIDQTVIVILVMISVRRDIDMVDPYVGGKLDTNGVPVCGKNLLDCQVPDNDILLALDKASSRTISLKLHTLILGSTYRPLPINFAPEFFPMMLVLLPTFV